MTGFHPWSQRGVSVAIIVKPVSVYRYVLISCPTEWSDELRVKFLEGLDAFLELLKCMQVCPGSPGQVQPVCLCLISSVSMVLNPPICLILCVSGSDPISACQGMDPVVRQVGQHIEMEPEWEAAFTLQMKLTHIISMIQEWCSTDVSPTCSTLHTTYSTLHTTYNTVHTTH